MTFPPVDVLEAHALRLEDPTARALVLDWHRGALALARYIESHGGERVDLVDASTLASLYLEASGHG